ncbi:MAG TPA: diaminopimelate dehydrogenase [Anaerolineaceae bacterium]|nr:diaminopimelate dehydrogenase [Anaerolineaceae bacterium]
MNAKIKVAVMGCGHIGQSAIQAVQLAPDMELVGALDVPERCEDLKRYLRDVVVVADTQELPEKPDVMVLTVPTRTVECVAPLLLAEGIHTVDCFDMHGEPFARLKASLDPVARAHNCAAVMGAGVDPGISTMIRALFEVWAPTGLTYVNYGPGMSMGHTVAAKSYPGVKDALSITRPYDPGCHKRDLYLELQPGADFDEVRRQILADPYFAHDDVRVFQVDDVTPLVDTGHRILVTRKGGSAGIHNQLLNFETTFHNPASTAQVMIGAARACTRLAPGAHTMLEVPLAALLPEPVEVLLKRLV